MRDYFTGFALFGIGFLLWMGFMISASAPEPLPLPAVEWLGYSVLKTNYRAVPAYTIVVIDGLPKTNETTWNTNITFTQYELGVRTDGVLVTRKVGPVNTP